MLKFLKIAFCALLLMAGAMLSNLAIWAAIDNGIGYLVLVYTFIGWMGHQIFAKKVREMFPPAPTVVTVPATQQPINVVVENVVDADSIIENHHDHKHKHH